MTIAESATPSSEDLVIIRVESDLMKPMLRDNDDILIDKGDAIARLLDGIYVICVK